MGSSRERGFSVTPEKLAFIEQKMQEMGIETREALAESAGLSIDVIKKLFARKNVDRATIEAITRKALKIEPTEIIETERWYRQSKSVQSQASTDIDWQQVCRGMLPIELDANPLISGDRVTLGIEDILPLDLVEQKERPKPTRDRSPENSQQILEEQEIPLPYNQFFDHVLTGCRSLNQQGKGIAIIGEPGAGKTTLLCAIADWIIKRDELPVFVFLQNLEAGLESYLLKVWLKESIRKREASSQLQDDLVEHCNAGRVWLLLDGVDEMEQAQQSLSNLAKEFRGWVGDVRIVLTCRVNVWDANRNELRSKFETYRSRGFRDEDQLIFIENFFAKAKQPETGNKLIEKLASAPARLKDLIKSPLLITLLCRTWKRKEGKLPATKAELYQGFTKTFYDWKDKPYVPEEKRPLLERALGELAKKAIDQQDFRFRLRESFIRQELDKFDSSFFRIACKLGWINKLGTAVENSDEAVYAFLHPTFQEYFAALAIDDWDHFLPRDHQDKPTQNRKGEVSYRVFEPQWKEVFLLWLGRSDVANETKENLLDALVEFKDGCSDLGFFWNKAHFLIAAGTAEFPYSYTDEIIRWAVTGAFGYFDKNAQAWQSFLRPISRDAESALREANRKKVVATLIDHFPSDEYGSWRATELIGKYCDNSLDNIEFLTQLLVNQHFLVRYEAAYGLIRIGINNRFLIEKLQKILDLRQDFETRLFASWTLGKVSYKNPCSIDALEKLLESCQDEKLCLRISGKLGDIDFDNTLAIQKLVQLGSSKISSGIYGEILKTLEKIVVRDSFGLAALQKMKVVEAKINERMPSAFYEYLGTSLDEIKKIELSIQQMGVKELINCLSKGSGKLFEIEISPTLVRRLIEIVSKEVEAVKFLVETLNDNQYTKVHSSLVYVAGVNSLDNLDVINTLISLLRTSQDESIYPKIVNALKRVDCNEIFPVLTSELKNILKFASKNEFPPLYQSCYEILWHCANNMSYSDFFEAWEDSPAYLADGRTPCT